MSRLLLKICYVSCLTFDEIPDYNYIINLMASENKYKDDILFEH